MLKILSLVLVVSALNWVGFRSAYATGNEEKAARFTERVKEGISKLGTGPQARVQIKLRNNTKLKGYISEANTTSFTVIDANGCCSRNPVSAREAGQRQQSIKECGSCDRFRNPGGGNYPGLVRGYETLVDLAPGLPLLVSFPLVPTLPIQILLISKTTGETGEEAEKLGA